MICNFSNVAFSICGFAIHWYSLAYIFGIIIALKLSVFLSQKNKINISPSSLEDFISFAIVGIILGGRAGYVLFYEFDYYSKFPMEIFKVWKGGMAFYGGFLGVVVSTYYFCRKRGINFWEFSDLWSISTPIGLFLGRIANFINGELPGKAADLPWSVVFNDGILRHPSQLYEAILEGLILFIVMIISFKKRCFLYKGRLSGIFCFGYGFMRFVVEFFREPDSDFSYKLFYMSGLNLNQYISVIMTLFGCLLFFKSLNHE
ncbi:MAG: prolipoprotein diacylglyceryl transferase [Holosporaceae bacterium]|nr:prolipoprotein diacylglyceryl transferase [Holosporaceae bacterium]